MQGYAGLCRLNNEQGTRVTGTNGYHALIVRRAHPPTILNPRFASNGGSDNVRQCTYDPSHAASSMLLYVSYPTCCPLVRFPHIGSIEDAARDGPCAHG